MYTRVHMELFCAFNWIFLRTKEYIMESCVHKEYKAHFTLEVVEEFSICFGSKHIFKDSGLTDECFRSWIAEDLDDKTTAQCTLCKKNINLLNMGISGLLRHMKAVTTHDDLAKERLKMSRESAHINELFKKYATPETQKDKSLRTLRSDLSNPKFGAKYQLFCD